MPVVPVLVTGQSTVAPLVAPLTAELARHGLLFEPEISPYGSFLRDLLEPAVAEAVGKEGIARPRMTLCLLDAHTVFEEVPVPWRAGDVEAAARSRLDLLGKAARVHQAGGGGPLVLNTVPLLRRHVQQLVDHRSRARLGALWREFNAGLLALAQEHPGVFTVDLDPLLAEGTPAHEPRTALYAKARLSEALLTGYAREVGHLARHLYGRTRKCLVLDLDGTLWGGVLGEEGTQGIEIGGGYRGEAFLDFQRVLKQLSSQGVLLAVSSKNDAGAVREALREHPGTLAVSSLGHRPVDGFHSVGGTAITLGVGRVVQRPVVRSGGITAAPVLRLNLSFDHRVLDGAEAADLLAGIRERLEHYGEDAGNGSGDGHRDGNAGWPAGGAALALAPEPAPEPSADGACPRGRTAP